MSMGHTVTKQTDFTKYQHLKLNAACRGLGVIILPVLQ